MPPIHILIVCFSSLVFSFVSPGTTSTCCSSRDARANVGKVDRSSAFERIKLLEGEWVRVDSNGRATDEVVSQFRITAGGSAVIETLFPGTEKEMITLYHMDGEDLVLTHYCVLGNQPHMRATEVTNNSIVFVCDCSGVSAADEAHMHRGTLKWTDKNRLATEWLQYTDGEVTYTAGFEVVRR